MKKLKPILLSMLFIVGVCLLQAQERNRVDSLYSSFLDSLSSDRFEIDELEEIPINDDSFIFTIYPSLPTFWGGDEALMRYLAANLKYPVVSINARLEGRVLIGFYIDEEGRVCDAKVEESVDPLLDAEVLRVVKSMPKWLPAKEFGKPVKSEPLTLPIIFKLKEKDKTE